MAYLVFLLIERKRGSSLRWWTPFRALACSAVCVSTFVAKRFASFELLECTARWVYEH